jgi:hypothetical protein
MNWPTLWPVPPLETVARALLDIVSGARESTQMKSRWPAKLRPSERPSRRRVAEIGIVGLGGGCSVMTHDYHFVVGVGIGVLVGALVAFAQRRSQTERITRSRDVG